MYQVQKPHINKKPAGENSCAATNKAFPLALCELFLWLLASIECSILRVSFLNESPTPNDLPKHLDIMVYKAIRLRVDVFQYGTNGQSYLQIYWLYLMALLIHWLYLFDLVALLIGFIYWLDLLALLIHWLYLFNLVALFIGFIYWL